jgi:osmotically inducible lipoprotein OsmB
MRRPGLAILAAALIINGCANMSNTDQRVLSGGAMGAAAGGGAGLLGGYL